MGDIGNGVASQYYTPHLKGTKHSFKNEPGLWRATIIRNFFVRQITELAINRFSWKGLPDTVDPRYLELTLFRNGLAVFYDDSKYGFLALQSGGGGNVNMYENPLYFLVNGSPMINKTIPAKDCVPIYNNYLRTPDVDIVEVYAPKLAELDVTIEVNTKNMRIPKIFLTTDGQRLSVDNFNRQVDLGAPVVVAAEGSGLGDNVTAHDVGIDPRNVDTLLTARSRHWADCMTALGINNTNQDKKERLISGEVESNNQQVLASRAVALNARREACRLINMKYGLKVEVDFNLDIDAVVPDMIGGEVDDDDDNVIA